MVTPLAPTSRWRAVGGWPYAPLFEVTERPNNWDRQLSEQKRSVEGSRSEMGQHRLDFWTHFFAAVTRNMADRMPRAPIGRSCPDAVVVQYLARNEAGVFVRPRRGGSMEQLELELAPHLERLSAELRAPARGQNSFLSQNIKVDSQDRAEWDRTSDWLAAKTQLYQAAFASALEARA